MKLHNYQLNNIQRIKDVKKVGLFLDMGLGKTITTLKAIDELLLEGKIKKVLVIAPLKVCNLVWGQEVEKWGNILSNIKIGVATSVNRDSILQDNSYNIVVINRDIVAKVVDFMGKKFNFDMLVVDESTSFKNPTSKRFLALKKKDFNYMVLLSGIPSPNHLLDIWAQVYLLDKGKALKSYSDYKRDYFNQDRSMRLSPINDATLKISRKIKHMCFSMKAKDYLELPTLIYNNIKINLPPNQLKQYKVYESELVLLDDNEEEVLTMVNSQLALMTKLMQYTSGFNYDNINNRVIRINQLKLDALKDILDDNPNTRFIVVYNFKEDKALILNNIKSCKAISRNGIEAEEWLNNEFRVLLIHPKSSGFGLNLQKGGNNIIWYSLSWSLEEYLQTNARIYRQGQSKPCVITHIVINDTIEKRITNALMYKMRQSNNLINELKV